MGLFRPGAHGRRNPRGRFIRVEPVPLDAFDYGDPDDGFLYHVTTLDRWPDIEEAGELSPGHPRQFAGAAAQTNSRGRLFVTKRDGVQFWAHRIAEQIESSRDLEEDENAEDFLMVLKVPREALSDMHQDTGETSGTNRDFFTTLPIPLETYIESP